MDVFFLKKYIIKKDNHFSLLDVEWIYLAIGDNNNINDFVQTKYSIKIEKARKDNKLSF